LLNKLALIVAGWLLLAAPAYADALTFPPLTGRVVDNAHVLTAEQSAALSAKLQTIEQNTGHQVVVATVPDLQGDDIADYGYQLGRSWGLGAKGKNDGVLILVAPTLRKARIDVGYGLEPILTDATSSLIIAQQMAPPFRDGNYAGGLNAAVNVIGELLQLSPGEAQARAKAMAAQQANAQNKAKLLRYIPWILFALFFILPLFGRRRGGYGYGGYGYAPYIPMGGFGGGYSGGSSGGGDSFSGGGGSFGGGGASGSW
jgi:uncharacterized protein